MSNDIARFADDIIEGKPRYAKPKGSKSPSWKGYNIGYRAAHMRLESQRGRAEQFDCYVCGDEADNWAYTHDDPNELIDPKLGYAYSADVDFYVPICFSCHWKLDRKKIELERVEAVAA